MIQMVENNELEQLLVPGVLQSRKVLIAEDDDLNFLLLKEYLDFSKAEVIWAKNGIEAIEIVKATPDLDVAILDIQMPEMDGFEAIKEIRRLKPNLRVIALTAYAVGGDREEIINAGFNEYISKPVSRKILISTILKYVM
jgi:two-component system sensor histidine kinase/response regulator